MPINLKRIFTDGSYTTTRGIYDRRILRLARVLYWCGVACAALTVVFFLWNRAAYGQYQEVLNNMPAADPQSLLSDRTILGQTYTLPKSPMLEGLAQTTQTTIFLFLLSIFGTYLFAFARIGVIAREKERMRI